MLGAKISRCDCRSGLACLGGLGPPVVRATERGAHLFSAAELFCEKGERRRVLLLDIPNLNKCYQYSIMSRGYGIVQRRIIAYMSKKSDSHGSIDGLCQFVYGDQFYLCPTKSSPRWGKLTTPPAKHRLAIIRAAKRLRATGFPIGWMRAHKGQGSPLYFYRTDNAESRQHAEVCCRPRRSA